MSNFEKAFDISFHFEGGFVDNKNDKGGATKYGISLRFLQSLPVPRADVNGDGIVSVKDILDLTPENVPPFYREYFWNVLHCDDMPEEVSIVAFDSAVNCGNMQSTKFLQRACNASGAVLHVDGLCGEKTVQAVRLICENEKGMMLLCLNMLHQRQSFYNSLAKSESHRTFHLGWTRRVSHLFEILWPTPE